MDKKTTQMIKGVAILIMIMHHFIVIPFTEFGYIITKFGYACKICVGIYAMLSGYGYFFAKEKTIKYGLKKIWGLLKIYWISLFTLFIPMALIGGWKITPAKLVVQLFGLLPNLNWFAWYVFFYIFCMLIMPPLCKYRVFRFKPLINLALMLVVPYIFEVGLHMVPNYQDNTIIHDLFSCFLYLPCFLVGYWMAENKIVDKIKTVKWLHNPFISLAGIVIIFAARMCIASVLGFCLDVIYAPLMICLLVYIFEYTEKYKLINLTFTTLGKYSTGMWFFHAVFFSTYVCDLFLPILKLVSWPPLMFVWLVTLSLAGAFFYQKILDAIDAIPRLFKRGV